MRFFPILFFPDKLSAPSPRSFSRLSSAIPELASACAHIKVFDVDGTEVARLAVSAAGLVSMTGLALILQFVLSGLVSAQASIYQQCGGIGWFAHFLAKRLSARLLINMQERCYDLCQRNCLHEAE